MWGAAICTSKVHFQMEKEVSEIVERKSNKSNKKVKETKSNYLRLTKELKIYETKTVNVILAKTPSNKIKTRNRMLKFTTGTFSSDLPILTTEQSGKTWTERR